MLFSGLKSGFPDVLEYRVDNVGKRTFLAQEANTFVPSLNVYVAPSMGLSMLSSGFLRPLTPVRSPALFVSFCVDFVTSNQS